jgi:hypothetical protein
MKISLQINLIFLEDSNQEDKKEAAEESFAESEKTVVGNLTTTYMPTERPSFAES